jgi:hypothetical protein
VMSGHRDKGASPHAAAPSGSIRGERGHREQSSARDRVTIPGSQNGKGPLTCGPGPIKKIFFQISKLHSNLQIQRGSLLLLQKYSKLA